MSMIEVILIVMLAFLIIGHYRDFKKREERREDFIRREEQRDIELEKRGLG